MHRRRPASVVLVSKPHRRRMSQQSQRPLCLRPLQLRRLQGQFMLRCLASILGFGRLAADPSSRVSKAHVRRQQGANTMRQKFSIWRRSAHTGVLHPSALFRNVSPPFSYRDIITLPRSLWSMLCRPGLLPPPVEGEAYSHAKG